LFQGSSLFFGDRDIILYATICGGIYRINFSSFLGSDECLTSSFMFHRDQKWRARVVKQIYPAESLAIFDDDNKAARYIWGTVNKAALIIRP
jgi:hypothetical protein